MTNSELNTMLHDWEAARKAQREVLDSYRAAKAHLETCECMAGEHDLTAAALRLAEATDEAERLGDENEAAVMEWYAQERAG